MNKNDFLSLIGSNNPIDRQILAEINDLVNIFPYFQTAHLLLLKGMQDNSDIRFENQLKNSAIHVADREVLYNLLKVSPVSFEQVKVQETVEKEPVIQEPVKEEPVIQEQVIEEPVMKELVKEDEVLRRVVVLAKPLGLVDVTLFQQRGREKGGAHAQADRQRKRCGPGG